MAEDNGRAREIASEVKGLLEGVLRELDQGRADRSEARAEVLRLFEKAEHKTLERFEHPITGVEHRLTRVEHQQLTWKAQIGLMVVQLTTLLGLLGFAFKGGH